MQTAVGRTTVSKKWQIVMPKKTREELKDVRPGQEAWVQPLDAKRVIVSFADPIEEGAGLLKSKKSLTKALLRSRRKERKREEEELQRRLRS